MTSREERSGRMLLIFALIVMKNFGLSSCCSLKHTTLLQKMYLNVFSFFRSGFRTDVRSGGRRRRRGEGAASWRSTVCTERWCVTHFRFPKASSSLPRTERSPTLLRPGSSVRHTQKPKTLPTSGCLELLLTLCFRFRYAQKVNRGSRNVQGCWYG